jgi:copper chaperone CopZ
MSMRLAHTICFGIVLLAGCSQSANPVAFNLAGAPTVEFSVPDMMCPGSCGVKVKEILSQQPGAKEVVVNFDAKTATVAIESGTFDKDAAVAALVDHQFEHSVVKSAGESASQPSASSAESPADASQSG